MPDDQEAAEVAALARTRADRPPTEHRRETGSSCALAWHA
jgi:hypothetical protein